MSQNSIELDFGDGSYTFALPLPQIAELQRKTDCGIGPLYARVIKGVVQVRGEFVLAAGQAEFYALDLIETIRHGLIGGGHGVVNGEEVKVTPILANRLVDTYVLGNPLMDSWSIAATVLGVCIKGYDPPKKDEPAAERATTTADAKAGSTTRKRSRTAQ